MSVPSPYPAIDLVQQDTLVLLALCLWGEARGESHEGRVAVACVVRNRVLQSPRFGDGWKGVLLKPLQFSCFNSSDPNFPKLLHPTEYGSVEIWRECGEIAEGVYGGTIADVTRASNHYHTIAQPRAAKVWPPKWARTMEKRAIIGRHVFLRG